MSIAPGEQERALLRKVADARAAESAAAQRLAVAEAAALALEGELVEFERSRTLDRFVMERTHSDDYRRHLGLMSVIRKDFETLMDKLEKGQIDGGKKIDRIILYIDDVDRLPAPKVKEVLEAVHLLLAMPLFVVVVCVDPRWMLHALQSQFDALGEAGAARPQDYLEKIIQIPFAVRPMGKSGFGALMKKALAPSPRPSADQNLTRAADGEGGQVPGGHTNSLGGSEGVSPGVESATAESQSGLETLARAISISDAETAFAKTLYDLLLTPRSAKRFANVYRLVKASVPSEEIQRFERPCQHLASSDCRCCCSPRLSAMRTRPPRCFHTSPKPRRTRQSIGGATANKRKKQA